MFSEQSKWISAGHERISPLIRRSFVRPKGHTGIHISGLGFFELYINGSRVGEDCLVPAFSDYRHREFPDILYPFHDELKHRIYVPEYDITPYLCDGENTLEILLGDGWYRQTDRLAEGRMHFGETLCARYEVFCEDKMIFCSDGTEQFTDSFIKKSSLFFGEVQDFSAPSPMAEHMQGMKEFCVPASLPEPVQVMEEFCDRYELQTCPPDRVMNTLTPVLVSRHGNTAIYDAGKSLSGRVRLVSDGGDGQIQQDEFYHTTSGMVCYPHFRWSAFRYLEVTGALRQHLLFHPLYGACRSLCQNPRSEHPL